MFDRYNKNNKTLLNIMHDLIRLSSHYRRIIVMNVRFFGNMLSQIM